MAHAESSRASAQSAANILSSYLAAQGHVLLPEDALDLCSRLALAEITDIKGSALPLRNALRPSGIQLKQTHALEVLARIAGHACYMRAKQAVAEPKATHVLLCAIDGEMEKPQGFASIGEAVTGMLSATLRLMPSRNEPAFCKLSRYPSGFQLEVSQLSGPWFSVQLVKFREDSLNAEDLVPLPVGDDSLRTAIRKVVANLEHARPATLVVRGAVAETLPPWYCAAFHVEGLRSRTARVVADERELFVFLDATGCDTLLTERGEALISGPDETFRVESAWVDVTGQDPAAKKVETTSTVKGLFQRYTRYRRALSGTVSEALVAIGSSSDAQWHAQASYETIESLANERKLTIPELAREAGIAFRDIKRLQDFELAAPELVVKLASALRVAPNRLLADRETNLGFAASDGGEFMKVVSGAMAYRRLEGQSLRSGDLDEARRILELAQDVSEVAAFELSEFAGAMVDAPKNESDARYEVMAQELLDDAKACGIKLIFSREVQFVQTGNAAAKDGGFMPMNVLTICAERIDGATPAMWTSIK